MWNFVTWHFRSLLNNLELSDTDHQDALGKAERVGKTLFKAYYPELDDRQVQHAMRLIGSYGKETAIKPTTDVDMLFILPFEVWIRFNSHQTNGPSNLLSEVRGILQKTYPRTEIYGDREVVGVDFESYKFEVVPAFFSNENDGSFLICETKNGGSWKKTHPVAEWQLIETVDQFTGGSLRALVKYLKAWKRHHSIEAKSIALEVLAAQFLQDWYYRNCLTAYGNPYYWYDWMVRDFFNYSKQFEYICVPGLNETVHLGHNWTKNCTTAHENAYFACAYERLDNASEAEKYWRNIFGYQFPQCFSLIPSTTFDNSPHSSPPLSLGLSALGYRQPQTIQNLLGRW